jgi:hypothetical protein
VQYFYQKVKNHHRKADTLGAPLRRSCGKTHVKGIVTTRHCSHPTRGMGSVVVDVFDFMERETAVTVSLAIYLTNRARKFPSRSRFVRTVPSFP